MLCPGSKHLLFSCQTFLDMTIQQREDHIRAKNLCSNCLSPGHQGKECRSWSRCKSCGGRHHTLIHRSAAIVNVIAATSPPNISSVSEPITTVSTNEAAISGANNSSNSNQLVQSLNQSAAIHSCLMMTSKVVVKGRGGRQTIARELLDSGATMSLISTKLASYQDSLLLSASLGPRIHP